MQYSAKISDFAIFKHSISPQGRICSVECNKRVLFSVAGGVALVRNIKMSSVQNAAHHLFLYHRNNYILGYL